MDENVRRRRRRRRTSATILLILRKFDHSVVVVSKPNCVCDPSILTRPRPPDRPTWCSPPANETSAPNRRRISATSTAISTSASSVGMCFVCNRCFNDADTRTNDRRVCLRMRRPMASKRGRKRTGGTRRRDAWIWTRDGFTERYVRVRGE